MASGSSTTLWEIFTSNERLEAPDACSAEISMAIPRKPRGYALCGKTVVESRLNTEVLQTKR